jgi:hypothetical protein
MSKKPKKTRKQEEESEGEDLLAWASNLTTVIIYGKTYQRIRYDGSEGRTCSGCHAKNNQLHQCACEKEYCPHCRGYSVACKCDPDVANAEVDGFMECVTLEGTI